MPIYAVAENVPERSRYYITPGKRYMADPSKPGSDFDFWFDGDDGLPVRGRWSKSGHLNGGNWTRIDEPDEAPSPDPRDALMSELAEALRGMLHDVDGIASRLESVPAARAALAKYEGANK
jgi:hypothetical protein